MLVELFERSGLAVPRVRKELEQELDTAESVENGRALVQAPHGNDRRQPLGYSCSLK